MDLNIRLLILDRNPEHAEELAKGIMPIIPFIHHEVLSTIQEALEAHLDNPFNISLVTSSIAEQEVNAFIRDMQKLYTQSQDRLCAFIKIMPVIPDKYNSIPDIQLGFATICSEKFDEKDQKNLHNALKDFNNFKQLNENISDIEWTMKMILAEVDRVSSDRARGRETKFNTIAIDFASDLVEFDSKVMDSYFDCLTEQTINLPPRKSQHVKIPKNVLKKSLPKLVEDRYTGASSRVWRKLVNKFGTGEPTE